MYCVLRTAVMLGHGWSHKVTCRVLLDCTWWNVRLLVL